MLNVISNEQQSIGQFAMSVCDLYSDIDCSRERLKVSPHSLKLQYPFKKRNRLNKCIFYSANFACVLCCVNLRCVLYFKICIRILNTSGYIKPFLFVMNDNNVPGIVDKLVLIFWKYFLKNETDKFFNLQNRELIVIYCVLYIFLFIDLSTLYAVSIIL